MASITKDKITEIINNRPDGSTPKSIINGLLARGHELEGFGVQPQGVTTVDAVEAEQPMTRGQEMLSEFKTGLETVGDASFGERAKLAAKGIGGAVSRTFEKTAEGFGDLGSLIGVATSGVDLNDEQKAQIFDDLEVQKKTQEYKDFISKKGSQLGLGASFIAPSATLAAIPKAKGVVRVGLGALAGLEAVTTDKIALEGELPTKGELATGAVLGGALPVAGAGLAKGKQFLGKTAPAQLLKSALKLTPTQKSKLTQLTVGGEDIQALAQRGASPEDIAAAQKDGNVFDWLVEKGYKGSPKEIGIQLAVDSAKSRQAKKVVLDQVNGKFRDEIGISAPAQILDDLVDVFTGSRGNEAKLSKAKGYLDRLKNEGLSVTELDEVKTFFDQNSSIFKAAGLGDAKAGAKSQGLATLRRELKEFIEKQAEKIGDIRQINKDISAARGASEAILERADAAGGNAIFKLTDVILGGSAGGAEFARTQDPIQALKVGFGVALGKRMLSNPNFQTALAKGLQKTFSDGEAGIVLKALQGDTTDVTTPIKKKFQNMLRGIVGESDEFADDISFKPVETSFEQTVKFDTGSAKKAINALRKGQRPVGKSFDVDNIVARERYDISKLEKISSGGSDRDVYAIGKTKVLKIAKTARGLGQNQLADWYAADEGLIPNIKEIGKNFVVFERVASPDAKTKKMISELKKIGDPLTGRNHNWEKGDKLMSKMEEFGYPGEELRNYGQENILWGDMLSIRNWGTKKGKPMLVDEGSLNNSFINEFRGVKNLDNPKFKDIYNESKRLREKFGDLDKNTMYGLSALMGLGLLSSQSE